LHHPIKPILESQTGPVQGSKYYTVDSYFPVNSDLCKTFICKIRYTEKFEPLSPVVDGVTLKYQLQYAVANQLIRPNTPISWNYAQNDGFGFVEDGWDAFYKVPAMAALQDEIEDLKTSSGIEFPSDYFNRWLAQIYPAGEILNDILSVFGCSNAADGSVVD